MAFAAKESQRVFHYLFTFSLLVGAITYYAQASNLGWSRVDQVDNLSNGDIRQVFWVKYVNWMLAFPSATLALGLISGVSWTTIICNICLSLLGWELPCRCLCAFLLQMGILRLWDICMAHSCYEHHQ
jgi:bacteriorhodopsin